MKILYGVCGEGMGHATRAAVVIEHLRARGHQVLVVASGQALRVLRSESPSRAAASEFPPSVTAALDGAFNERAVYGRAGAAGEERGGSLQGESLRVIPIVGLGMRCQDGALDLRGTIEENAQRLPRMLMENAPVWAEAERFAPDAAITDYDSFVWFFATAHRVPIVSIDNAQVLPRCMHRRALFREHEGGMRALEAFTVAKAPSAQHYIVTTFFYPPVKPHLQSATTLVPPILRSDVLKRLDGTSGRQGLSESHLGEHVLVYKTGSLDDATFVRPLAQVPEQRFVVYGLRDRGGVPANVDARPFDTGTFLADLASSRGVIGNAGMSLLGEALAFGKPIYGIPVRGQYEQVLNACYLEQLGYGTTSETLEPERLRAFLAHADAYKTAITRVPQHDGNMRLFYTLDALFPGTTSVAVHGRPSEARARRQS